MFYKNKLLGMLTLACCVTLTISPSSFADQSFPATASFDVGFSPEGSALQVVLNGINAAHSSILMASLYTNEWRGLWQESTPLLARY